MTIPAYTKKTWVNDGAPAISAANLQNMSDQIDAITDVLDGTDTDGLDNVPIGKATPAAGNFTDIDATGDITVAGTVDGIDIAALDGQVTAVEKDIDYPSAVKQKAIVDTGEDGGVEGGVFNGDLEYGSGSTSTAATWIGDEKYGWALYYDNLNVTASYDNNMLKVVAGASGVNSNLSHLVSLDPGDVELSKHGISCKPSTTYRLSVKVKSTDVGGVKIKLRKYVNSSSYTVTTYAELSVADEFEYLEIVFTTGASDKYLRIQLEVYVPDSVTYFDDIKLEQIDEATVNTQADVIAGVSVEGVTTTDNIDQSQTTGTNAIANVSSIDTGGQTFTPTEERHTKMEVYTYWDGDVTGTGTCKIFKWDTNYATTIAGAVLASQTIAEQAMTNGGYTAFELPCILEAGEVYLYHLTGTGTGAGAQWKVRGNVTTNDYGGGASYSNGATYGYDMNFKQQFAKHTASPIVEANGSKLDLTGVKLLTGVTITINADGSSRYIYDNQITDAGLTAIHDLDSTTVNNFDITTAGVLAGNADNILVWKFGTEFPITSARLLTQIREGETRSGNIYSSIDGVTYDLIHTGATTGADGDGPALDIVLDVKDSTVIYLKFDMNYISADWLINYITVDATLNCQSSLPILTPTSEVSVKALDLVQNPIDISEDVYWSLDYDLTGWSSQTIEMETSEANWEAQVASAETIYVYDSNGTGAWTWDERNGLVPPADRTTGAVMAKFIVGDNQIRCSVNDGSMKANVNLSWTEASIRKMLNDLTHLINEKFEELPEIVRYAHPILITDDTEFENVVPTGYELEKIVFIEGAGNAATIDLGTTSGASDVFSQQVIAASSITTVILNKTFSMSAEQSLYLNDDGAGSFNSASLTAILLMRRVI